MHDFNYRPACEIENCDYYFDNECGNYLINTLAFFLAECEIEIALSLYSHE